MTDIVSTDPLDIPLFRRDLDAANDRITTLQTENERLAQGVSNLSAEVQRHKGDLHTIAELLYEACTTDERIDEDTYNELVEEINDATRGTWLKKTKVQKAFTITVNLTLSGPPDEVESIGEELESWADSLSSSISFGDVEIDDIYSSVDEDC